MDLGLTGKTALVVGASRGIGRAVALALGAEGMRVAVMGRSAEALAETVDQLRAGGAQAGSVVLDAARADQARWLEAREAIEAELGPVEVLVYAAAAPDRPARLATLPETHWNDVLATDLGGLYRCAQVFLPGMAQRGWGRVMALGSLMGLQGGFAEGAYAAAKAGLVGLIKTIAQEYARQGITANLVIPGRIATERTAGLSERAAEAMKKAIAMRREGTPEEVAAVVAFLASVQASYVTGAEIPVTGGRELGMLSL